MLRLAFLWHQHQPYYRDPRTGTAALPWVRLHATKDYYGMARLISEFPGIRATVNLVPSLVEQLEAYAAGTARDAWLDLMEPAPEDLAPADRERLLAIGFHANPRTMIAALPRYDELYRRKRAGGPFSLQDLRDLQLLANLAWFHRTLLDEDPLLTALRAKGRDFGEEDKRALFEKSREVAASVLPLHRALEAGGRIELTTTPYYHPILPLLCDFRSAFEAMPWLATKLPFEPVSLREDAVEQVRRAVALHERVFGRRPSGMWPAEGSVSPAIVPIVAGGGARWIASDEEILARSLERPIRRDGQGNVIDGDLLYRPWRVRHGSAEVAIVFRDRRLSDLFGFDYHRDPEGGVRDFLRRLAWIRDHARSHSPLVSVILDGENAWEHYPEGAVPFFRALYRALEDARDWVEMVALGDAIARAEPLEVLPKLFSGSWIDHNFYIWIGHEEDRRAWQLLLDARAALVEAEKARRLSSVDREAAWRSVYVAEGSDWYWWYGDDRSSGMDDVFDALFRENLKNVWRAIGRPPPPALESPIARSHEPAVRQPSAFLDVRLDGRRTSFFEWAAAGRFRADDEAGTMSRAQAPLEEICFGFDEQRLFIALDFGEDSTTIFASGGSVRVHFLEPTTQELSILGPGRMRFGDVERSSVAIGQIVELEVPWADLGARPGDPVRFYVEVRRPGSPPERAPRGFAIRTEVPGEDFEARAWAV